MVSDHPSDALQVAMAAALDYATSIDVRRVAPDAAARAALATFDEPLPDTGADVLDTIRQLHESGSPATVASTGRRYFGFVQGATLPAALGASWLAARGIRTRHCRSCRRSPRSSTTSCAAGWSISCTCPTRRVSPSLAVRQWRTRRAWPPRATRCSPTRVGTCRPTDSSAHPISQSWSASGPTPRCRSRSDSSASAGRACTSFRPTTKGGSEPSSCPISTVPCSCARRPVR